MPDTKSPFLGLRTEKGIKYHPERYAVKDRNGRSPLYIYKENKGATRVWRRNYFMVLPIGVNAPDPEISDEIDQLLGRGKYAENTTEKTTTKAKTITKASTKDDDVVAENK